MVLFEDSVALLGVLIAALGIALNELTGAVYFDPAASVLIRISFAGCAGWRVA